VNASKTKALKDYHKNDFILSERISKNQNTSEVNIADQSVTFRAEDNNFRLEATGFDERRDLIVDVSVGAIVDEAI